MHNFNRILVLAPHTDDGELGCGGTIAKYISEGKEVWSVAFSTCEKSLPEGFEPGTLGVECIKANAALGVSSSNITLLDYEVRELPTRRQDVLETLVSLNKEIKPDLVLLPAKNDIHQDHQVVYEEGLRAFRKTSIMGYELPWNNTSFRPTYFQHLTPGQLDKKILALKMYRSQSHRNYMSDDFIRALARVRGVQADKEYAEAFEVYKIIH